jgi:hypothetical protein
MKLTDEEIEELMKQALFESRIEVNCPHCQGLLTTEPDADDAWCEGCNEVVKKINPLIQLGLI